MPNLFNSDRIPISIPFCTSIMFRGKFFFYIPCNL
ncbi:hypothetical protein CY0110_19082 [Crocosphaera chwakensis CCY0110]|uniref:Uncharacterized protein n=1 Tax=Crocosphaera chwakensis CCY0110 TaxID=391612 RepID=A3IJE8_9CHRO|nr:hypothetical protein CY0110_19082 [Crocosphaera chwakensis CCY0110]